ncbi:hypothetical protein GOBAR_DD34157 [Gossypium barbadense]|nr:hypothetical protein GOBAR_DD34157 [Gossypium barbadense]
MISWQTSPPAPTIRPYEKPFVSSSTFWKTSTCLTKLCFPRLEDSESTRPPLLITTSLMKSFFGAESALEFESSNYGMVPAKESLVKEMVRMVRVEDGDQEDCMICLEELEVGFYASRMPCSHTFHGDCIENWLKQSHYCPFCRFEMPTN